MSDIGNKMAARLREKITDHERNTRCGRVDLALADYRRVGAHDVQVMVEYARDRGAPQPSQLCEWVTAEFNGGFRTNLATVRNHPELSAMTMHLSENRIPMPTSRCASMLKLGGGQYIDKHQNQWSVEKAANGEDVLVRSSDVQIDDILEERINRQRSGRYARVHLGMVRTAGVADLEAGDTVLYADPAGGQLQKTGVLTKVGPKSVTIKGMKGDLDRSYVVDIVDKNAAAVKKEQKYLIDFFAENLFAGDKATAAKAVK